MSQIADEIKKLISGDITVENSVLDSYSHDASLFELRPEVIVYPKTDDDVCKVVDYVSKQKKSNPKISITGRGSGTDMSGGAISDSIILDFKKYFTNIESTMIQNNPCNLVILDECSYTGDIQTVVDFLQQNEHTSTEIIFFNSYLNNGLASTLENTHNEIIFTNIFNFKCTHKMLPVYMSLKDELFKESNYSFDYICR